uniref:procollagen-proline 4-dioxygenase n=1 Tax=Cucumis melo TaxID=3656 RepID=A0A9I9CXL2_CUCME
MLFRESMQSNFPLEETSISMVINGGFAIAANPLLGSLNFFINEYEPQESNLYLPLSSPFSFFVLISIFYIHFVYVSLSLLNFWLPYLHFRYGFSISSRIFYLFPLAFTPFFSLCQPLPQNALTQQRHDENGWFRHYNRSHSCHSAFIQTQAKGKLRQSLVAAGTGESVTSKERTSTGMFLRKAQVFFQLAFDILFGLIDGRAIQESKSYVVEELLVVEFDSMVPFSSQDKIVARIESRIAAWTFLPLDNGEPIQILRYENGQKYEPHFDFFQDPGNIAIGGHRIATILMYLSDVEKGGETVFPNSPVKLSEEEKGDLSECAKVGYGVRPKLGDALLFFSMNPNVTPDATSYHGSCPVIEGEKWSATKWIHMLPIDEVWRNPACVDENDHCSAWAKAGECKKNPVYMMGSKNELGFCRLSCKVC